MSAFPIDTAEHLACVALDLATGNTMQAIERLEQAAAMQPTPRIETLGGAGTSTDHVVRVHRDRFFTPHPFGEMMPNPFCERCGAPVVPLQAPNPNVPPKRFCSLRCQKAAGKLRWLQRHRAQAKKEKINA